MSSEVLFEAPMVRVTTSLLEIKGKTWQIRNIDSVELKYAPFMGPINTTWGIVLGILLLPAAGFGLLPLGWAIWVMVKKPRMIYLETSKGSVPAGWCDKAIAEKIKEAIEGAMESRAA